MKRERASRTADSAPAGFEESRRSARAISRASSCALLEATGAAWEEDAGEGGWLDSRDAAGVLLEAAFGAKRLPVSLDAGDGVLGSAFSGGASAGAGAASGVVTLATSGTPARVEVPGVGDGSTCAGIAVASGVAFVVEVALSLAGSSTRREATSSCRDGGVECKKKPAATAATAAMPALPAPTNPIPVEVCASAPVGAIPGG